MKVTTAGGKSCGMPDREQIKLDENSRYPCDEPPCEAWVAEVINGFVVLAEKN